MKIYRPIEFRHVCAIARAVLLASPAMTDADWKEAVKETCERQGWQIPESEMLARAFGAVERALAQTTGFSRPVWAPSQQPNQPQPDRSWTADDYRALANTLKQVAARQAAVASPSVVAMPTARVSLNVSEAAALDQFYAEAETDRVGALKRFAEIALVRPADWSFAAVRAEADKIRVVHGQGCFGCRKSARGYQRHHVIQIQHGGSNYLRNIVVLCDDCHAAVHPWLPAVERTAGGWASVGSIAPAALAAFERDREKKASA